MKLIDLARMAKDLPVLNFDWAGVEQYHLEVFNLKTEDLASLREYVSKIKERVSEQSIIIHDLVDAYTKLKDIILECEINEPNN